MAQRAESWIGSRVLAVSLVASLAGSAAAMDPARVELLGDAATRTALLAADDQAASAGRDARGTFIGSGDTKLYITGFMQFRYYVNTRDSDVMGDTDDLTNGFAMRRARVVFSGQLTKQLGFNFTGNASSSDGTLGLLDAFADWKFDNGVKVKWGQFKLPLLREELIFDTQQLAIERSIANDAFSQTRSQGVEVSWAGENVRLAGAFSDGLKTLNTDFDSATEADYALTARGEYKWAGEWKDFDRFSSWRTGKYAGSVGAAVHWQDGGETTATLDQSFLQYTVDAMAKGAGWNLYAAFIGKNTEPATGPSFDDFAYVVQGGYFFSDQIEGFARFSHVIPDDSRANGDDFKDITVGANYYVLPESNALKITGDVLWALDDQSSARDVVKANASNGFLGQSEENEIAFRLQFQLVF
jgi:hypothetical protein